MIAARFEVFAGAWCRVGRRTQCGISTFKARAEDIVTKPPFRESIIRRLCVVPADLFFEWQCVGKVKQPYAITTTDGLLRSPGFAIDGTRPDAYLAGE